MGEEPSGLSLTKLTKQLPVLWDEQNEHLEFAAYMWRLRCQEQSIP